ncbi:hypothetical protein COMA2_20243 [Candidatus Nitrospira nitrificans]|uniref:Uncharacterized protein n=1 Tax=Candidatus Nitrospira nitrificans TaxID=1742973 RepID=A0A0S4LFK9_9BACT|nr:hypothetical protein COMA2_20243 [Candidatus Nitrospira nitrificans]
MTLVNCHAFTARRSITQVVLTLISQHKGMRDSYVGALQDQSVVPLLVKALEDDHAYVRSCAALGDSGDSSARTTEDRHGTGLGSNREKPGQGSAGTDAGMTILRLAARPIPAPTQSRQFQAGS